MAPSRPTPPRARALSVLAALTIAALAAWIGSAAANPPARSGRSDAGRSPRSFPTTGDPSRQLGVTYGPYLGKRCRHADYRHCELVGIDIVFRRAATRVVAISGGQRIRLRTPGKHSAVTYHDWVGNFTAAGFTHLGVPVRRPNDYVHAPVELRVRFAGGRRVHALFPQVLVSPRLGLGAMLAAPLPPGWHEVDRPLTGIIYPVQVYAAATFPIVLRHPPGQCGPPASVLAEMPPGGVLLQVIEDAPWAPDGRPIRVPRLPRRPARFSWSDATWGRFECAGPSFQFTYRQEGRALQAQVWMHRGTVDTRLRAGALRLLDNLSGVRPG